MPRKPKQDDPAESKRFIEAARQIGADESPGAMDRAFKKIVREQRMRKKPKVERPK